MFSNSFTDYLQQVPQYRMLAYSQRQAMPGLETTRGYGYIYCQVENGEHRGYNISQCSLFFHSQSVARPTIHSELQ